MQKRRNTAAQNGRNNKPGQYARLRHEQRFVRVRVDGETVFRCRKGDADDLTRAIRDALANPDACARVGAAGRQRVLERWTWRRCAELTVEQYREVLAMPEIAEVDINPFRAFEDPARNAALDQVGERLREAGPASAFLASPQATNEDLFAFKKLADTTPMADDLLGQLEQHVRCALPRGNVLAAGQTWRYTSVFGVVEPGQLRREFLAYLERRRAHPYRPFLHYNSWYHLNIGRPDSACGRKSHRSAYPDRIQGIHSE